MTPQEKSAVLAKRVAPELDKARQALAEAEHLLRGEFWEAAISRSYYAIFHAARAVLYQAGSAPITHRGVMSEFSRLIVKTGKIEPEYHEIIQESRNERQAEDYETAELESLPDPELARDIVTKARKFVERIAAVVQQAEGGT